MRHSAIDILMGRNDVLSAEHCFHLAHPFFPINISNVCGAYARTCQRLSCVFGIAHCSRGRSAQLCPAQGDINAADGPVCRMWVPTNLEGLTWEVVRAHDAHSSLALDWNG